MFSQLLVKRWEYQVVSSSNNESQPLLVPSAADVDSDESGETSLSGNAEEYFNVPGELICSNEADSRVGPKAPVVEEVLLRKVPVNAFVSSMLARANPTLINNTPALLKRNFSKGFSILTKDFLEADNKAFETRLNVSRGQWAKSKSAAQSAGLEQIVKAMVQDQKERVAGIKEVAAEVREALAAW